MSQVALERLIREADALSVAELLRLAAVLRERAQQLEKSQQAGVSWSELRGCLTHEPDFDAQEWVSKNRAAQHRDYGGGP